MELRFKWTVCLPLLLLVCCSVFCFPAALLNGTASKFRSTNASYAAPDEPVPLKDFKLPDHLNGVKLERDGHINNNFRFEVILGRNDALEMKKKNPDKLLRRIFKKADKDRDGQLSVSELTAWISSSVDQHLDKAIRDNLYIFMTLDRDHNGIVTWEEYHSRYLLEHGMDDTYVQNHSEKHKDLTRQVREEILLDKVSFFEAANTNINGLNIDEFLSFRHPERSHATLLTMVQDIFDKLDENSDEVLCADEFMSLKQEDISNSGHKLPEDIWKKERLREFEQVIDLDKDGKVTRQELVMYSDPKNPAHAFLEALTLINAADKNRNGKLSLKEVLDNRDLFIGSKMVDIAKKFHDEF